MTGCSYTSSGWTGFSRDVAGGSFLIDPDYRAGRHQSLFIVYLIKKQTGPLQCSLYHVNHCSNSPVICTGSRSGLPWQPFSKDGQFLFQQQRSSLSLSRGQWGQRDRYLMRNLWRGRCCTLPPAWVHPAPSLSAPCPAVAAAIRGLAPQNIGRNKCSYWEKDWKIKAGMCVCEIKIRKFNLIQNFFKLDVQAAGIITL